MVFVLIIFLAAAVVTTLILVVRRQTRNELPESRQPDYLDRENLRPLFAPDEEELRAEERQQKEAEDQEAAYERAAKKLASFNEFRQTWRESNTRMNTIELLRRASEMESGEIYLETVDAILHNRTGGFDDDDLAQLIESHFWLLPAHEKTPGAAYTIKRELAALRGSSNARSEEADHKS